MTSSLKLSEPKSHAIALGGDEFILVIEGPENPETLESIANRIIKKIERPILWADQKCHVGASIGIVKCHTVVGGLVDDYLQAADEALYASKKAGRGRYRFAN